MHYNKLLLQYQRKFDFDLISFDWASEKYEYALNRIANRLNLKAPAQSFSFFQPALRICHETQDDVLPSSVADTYRAMQNISEHLLTAR